MLELDEVVREIGGAVVLTVHDEIVAVVPEIHAEAMFNEALQIMRTPPAWALGLPSMLKAGTQRDSK